MEPNQILKSANSQTEKYIYLKEKYFYSTVYFYDESDNSINSCCSSQIGCPESCIFCATGDHSFIRNLAVEELEQQFGTSTSCLAAVVAESRPTMLYIIMEGMGEPTYNLPNISTAFSRSIPELLKIFTRVKFRISTAGNVNAIPIYKNLVLSNTFPSVEHQFQVSLHSSLNEDRRDLIPGFGTKHTVHETIESFYDLALWLNQKLKINYLLLDFNGKNNYGRQHLDELIRLLDGRNAKIKLTSYSDTGKKLSSPGYDRFREVQDYLQKHGIETKIRNLVGEDIYAACGMLHYG